MHFGIFSNGFRPHTTAAQTYEEDLFEIILADKLGFRDFYISEHHGEPPYINRVDTIPTPELLMCKAASLTTQIRMGAAIKLIHMHHPLDVAIQSAVTEHLLGKGRFIFGFGTGFPSPLFCDERGITFDDRHARLQESLEFILKCWASDDIFDWEGEHWNAKGVVALPKPLSTPHMPMLTATDTEAVIKLSAERGYALLSAFLEDADHVRKKADRYINYAADVGVMDARQNIITSRVVYVADSYEEAIEDMRAAVTYEISVQAERGFLKVIKKLLNLDIPNDGTGIEALAKSGFYLLGKPDRIAEQIKDFYDASGGFGTFLIVGGKDWATREKRARSMTRFMGEVAPQLRHLEPSLGSSEE